MIDNNDFDKADLNGFAQIDENFNYDEHAKISQSWFDNSKLIIDHIYLDLIMLKDIQLSALFSVSSSMKNSYKYILANLNSYDNRHMWDDIFTYFPKLKPLEKMYNKALQDDEIHPYLWHTAPSTMLYVELYTLFETCRSYSVMHTDCTTRQSVYKPTITINHYPYKIDSKLTVVLYKQFSHLINNFNLEFVYCPIHELKKEYFDKFDLLILSNLCSLFSDETSPLYESIFLKNEFMNNRYIWGPPYLDQKNLDSLKSKDDLGRAMGEVTGVMMAYFGDYKPSIPVILDEVDVREIPVEKLKDY